MNVAIELTVDDILIKEPNQEELRNLFEELEFRSMLIDLVKVPPRQLVAAQGNLFSSEGAASSLYKSIKNTVKNYKLIDTEEAFSQLLVDLKEQKVFCFDTETTSLDVFSSNLVGIAFSWQSNSGYFLYLPKDILLQKDWLGRIATVLESESYTKVGQNLKFDMK